jgi:hypothetical protein
MNTNNRGVDHLNGAIVSGGKCVHDPSPNARAAPANKAIVARGVGTEALWQVTPGCPRSQDPEYAIQHAPVVHAGHAAGLVWQHRLDRKPFLVGEFVAHDSSPLFRALNHNSVVGFNQSSNGPEVSVGTFMLVLSAPGMTGAVLRALR